MYTRKIHGQSKIVHPGNPVYNSDLGGGGVELRQLTTNGLRTLINININYDVGRLRTLMSMIIFMM